MRPLKVLVSAFKARRAKRKWERGLIPLDESPEAMLGHLDNKGRYMPAMGPITESKTTKTIAGSAAASGGAIYGLIIFARAMFPNHLWDADADAAVVTALSAIATPLLSRWFTSFRK